MKKISSIVFVYIFVIYANKVDTTFYNSGEIKNILPLNKNGKEHGIEVSFFRSGIKSKEANYLNGLRSGTTKGWYKNGQLRLKTLYKQDKGYGWHAFWDSLGNPTDSVFYSNGKKIERIDFFKGTNKRRLHQYYHWVDTERILAMEDIYDKSGKIISQIRSGNGYTHQYALEKYYGLAIFENGKGIEFRQLDVKDPRHARKPISKSKLLPWDVEKYGSIK